MKKLHIIILIISMAVIYTACEEYLEESPPGELAPGNLLSTQEGVESVLNSAYYNYAFGYGYHEGMAAPKEYPCDILYQTGGGMNKNFVIMSQFQWTPSTSTTNFGVWSRYNSIRDANIVIDNIDNFKADEQIKAQLLAEARYIRAVDYVYLYDAFGSVPLRTSSTDPPDLPRAEEQELLTFIEEELETVVADLPAPGEVTYGRATKGAALGFLARFHLNNKEWQKAAEACQGVMDLNYYALFPSYRDLFKVENEPDKNSANREMIAVATNTNVNPYGNKISACAQPPGFHHTEKLPEFQATGIANWASQFRFYDSFVNSFDQANDERFSLIFSQYVNQGGNTVDLTTSADNYRTLKFFDNAADAASHGNDFPMLRYADVLLMRAEALNEINGPTNEAVGLNNQVRSRAGLVDLDAGDFTKESLRDHILMERGWEFYYEGLRRSDLIRHGKFVSKARDRGVTAAQDFHVLYPIPQGEVDANSKIIQNDGY